MKFRDIPQLTLEGTYEVNVSWGSLASTISEHQCTMGLELDPDFQRGHVWTEVQQIRYCEWILRGGKTGRQILFNCPTWYSSVGKDGNNGYVLIDGKQRIRAVLRFMNNEIPVFGKNYRKDFTDNLRILTPDFRWNVNNLATREQVLQMYLDLNSGGTPHSEDEIERVRKLLEDAKKGKGKKK